MYYLSSLDDGKLIDEFFFEKAMISTSQCGHELDEVIQEAIYRDSKTLTDDFKDSLSSMVRISNTFQLESDPKFGFPSINI